MKLQRVVSKLDMHFIHTSCAHRYYSSNQMFVEHVLGAVYGIASSHVERKLVGDLLRCHRLCSVCRNIILSIRPLHLLIMEPCRGGWIHHPQIHRWYTWFHINLVNHPRFGQLILKNCNENVFHYLCRFLETMCLKLVHKHHTFVDDEVNGNHMYIGALNIHCQLMLKSIKYWKKKHLQYFICNHAQKTSDLMHSVARRLKRNEFEYSFLAHRALSAITVFLDKLLVKCRKWKKSSVRHLKGRVKTMKLEFIHIGRGNDLKDFEDRGLLLRKGLQCAFAECSKTESNATDRFKMCGGCKMSYYCCKSCQKKAWPQHKSNCLKISKLYTL